MEPRPRGRGNSNTEITFVCDAFASMEPRPRGRGNDVLGYLTEAEANASMEPRPRGRGNKITTSLETMVGNRFNGAATTRSRKRVGLHRARIVAASLQWSRDHAVAETKHAPENSARLSSLQWSRDHAV